MCPEKKFYGGVFYPNSPETELRLTSLVHAAQDKKSEDSLMQEMRCGKGNVGIHSVWVPGVGKGKDADLGLRQDGFGTNRRGRLSRIMALGKGAGLLNSLL